MTFQRLALIGCGLMGGSFALALREAGLVKTIVGFSASEKTRQRAVDLKVIDQACTSVAEAVQGADLVLLALGFTGAEESTLVAQAETEIDSRGNVARDANWATNQDGFFVAGDAGRGQSLIVWAIAEGRAAAAAIDNYLEGITELPAPVKPTDKAISI